MGSEERGEEEREREGKWRGLRVGGALSGKKEVDRSGRRVREVRGRQL